MLRRGLMPGRDLALVSFDDSDWMAHTHPAVAAITQPVAVIARAAWARLLPRPASRLWFRRPKAQKAAPLLNTCNTVLETKMGAFITAAINSTILPPSLEIVASLWGDWVRGKAANIANDMLTAHPDLVGIFAANDGMALGAVATVFAAGKFKKGKKIDEYVMVPTLVQTKAVIDPGTEPTLACVK